VYPFEKSKITGAFMDFLWLTKDDWTLAGAIIAGATGIANLTWQWRDRNDSIFVRCGSLHPSIDQYNSLYVVNVGKHPVQLHDYGFLLASGKLMSLPWYWETEGPSLDPEHSYTNGERKMPPQGTFEAGIEYRGSIVGVWAMTATQHRPKLAFSYDTPVWQRAWLTVRHFVKPAYA
jgi:hypothetical protein